VASDICNFVEIYEKHLNVSINAGNKSMDSNGLKRMSAFNDYTFVTERGLTQHEMSYFQTYDVPLFTRSS